MTEAPPQIIRPRHLEPEVIAALGDRRAVLIGGARQAGKTTLAEMALRGRRDTRRAYLDDQVTRAAATEDPAEFVRHDGTMYIDEVQRVPELLLAIKAAVDRSNRPGQFLLTGSANLLTIPTVADALPGRMEILHLWPLSQGEIDGQADRFVDRAFGGWKRDPRTYAYTKMDYLRRAVAGGFPEAALRIAPERRHRWYESYVESLITRDIKDVARIERPDDLRRILSLLAARSANLYKHEELSRDANVAPTTAARYLNWLETAYLVDRIPAWANSRTTRALRAAKVFITDSGLLAYLLETTAEAAAQPGGLSGQLLESFVAMELRRQLGWSSRHARLHHFHNRDGAEVDLLLEASDGQVVGIEVKASSAVRSEDFRGLRFLAERTGDKFRAGVVLYTGAEEFSFGERMWCAPMASLWLAAA